MVGCGHQKHLPIWWKPAKRLFDTYELSYIANGSAWYESSAAKRQFMPAGSCVVFFPGVESFYQPCDYSLWEEYWIHFQGPVVRLLESEGIIRQDKPVFYTRRSVFLLKLFRESVRIALDRSERAQRRLSGRVLNILNEILLLDKETATGSTPSGPITSLVRQIRLNPAKKWNFQFLSREMGVNYYFLIKQFKKVTALPPHQFVNLERMKLACQYLAKGCTVQETCFRIGMEDPYHFSRLFKEIMDKAPLYFHNIRKA